MAITFTELVKQLGSVGNAKKYLEVKKLEGKSENKSINKVKDTPINMRPYVDDFKDTTSNLGNTFKEEGKGDLDFLIKELGKAATLVKDMAVDAAKNIDKDKATSNKTWYPDYRPSEKESPTYNRPDAYLGIRPEDVADYKSSTPKSKSPSNKSSGGSTNKSSDNKVTGTPTVVVTPDGGSVTGYIINGRTYMDPEGKIDVPPGTFVKAGGKWYQKNEDGSGSPVNVDPNYKEPDNGVNENGWDGDIRTGNKGYSDAPKKELLTAQELAEIYGLTWDANEIYDLYKEGVEETYDQLAYENRAARNQLSDTLAGQYDLYSSSLRDQRAGAIQSGMSKGTAAAQEVLSLLGAQGQSADVLSEYTQMMNMQANTKSKALTDAKERAFQDSNFITQYLGNLGLGIYNADVQQDVAKLAAQAQMEAARIQSAGNIAASKAAASRYNQPMSEFGWLANYYKDDPALLAQYLTGETNVEPNTEPLLFRGNGIGNAVGNVWDFIKDWKTPQYNTLPPIYKSGT
jgi:Tfp pilus assembly protein PilV